MAQTKTKDKTKDKKAKRSGKAKAAKAKNARDPKAAASRTRGTNARSKASQNGKAKTNPVKAMGEAAGNAGKDAGNATSQALSKARIPLLAGGAALAAGTVGGVVLGATRSGGKVLGVKLPQSKRVKFRSKDLARAAKEVGRFGENVGDLSTELRKAREGLANGTSTTKHDSPVEVLLKGLTNRH